MSRVVCAFALSILLAAGSGAQSPDLSVRWVSPTADTYLSGPVLLRVVFVGEGGGSRVEDVTFFADGKQVCVTPGAKPECSWDAGAAVTSHALRAVARLKSGGRLVSAIRTKAIEHAETVSVDVVLANAIVTDGGRFVKGLTRAVPSTRRRTRTADHQLSSHRRAARVGACARREREHC